MQLHSLVLDECHRSAQIKKELCRHSLRTLNKKHYVLKDAVEEMTLFFFNFFKALCNAQMSQNIMDIFLDVSK